MIRLILSATLRNPRVAAGPGVLFLTAALLSALALTIAFSVAAPSTQLALEDAPPGTAAVIAQVALFMMVLGIGVPLIFVTSAVAGTSVEIERPLIASWRLAGAAPGQVRAIVLARLLLTALIASVIGALLSPLLVQPAVDFLLQVTTIDVPILAQSSPAPLALAVAAVCLLALVGGLLPASRATRVAPLEVLRTAQPAVRPRISRGIFGIILAAATVLLAASAAGQPDPGPASTLALIAAFAAAGTTSVLAPIIVSPILRGWTLVVPRSGWPAWWVARTRATQRLSATSSTVAPLVMVLIVIGVYFSSSRTWEIATGQSEQAAVNAQQGLVLFAPGAVIALVGAGTVLFSVVGFSRHEQQQLRSLGASPATLLIASLVEPLIYVATAILIALPIVFLITAAFTAALRQAGLDASPALSLDALGLAALTGYIVTALATAPSTAATLRRTAVAKPTLAS